MGRRTGQRRVFQQHRIAVEALAVEEVSAWAEGHLRPGGGGLVLAGDLELDEAQLLLERHFGDWQGAPPPPRASPRYALAGSARWW